MHPNHPLHSTHHPHLRHPSFTSQGYQIHHHFLFLSNRHFPHQVLYLQWAIWKVILHLFFVVLRHHLIGGHHPHPHVASIHILLVSLVQLLNLLL